MDWNLQPGSPIYPQIVGQFKARIVSGVYPPGMKLPSVRDLAAETAVNPNTMQKALSELERSGLIYTQRTAGRYITEDEQMIARVRSDVARALAGDFICRMQDLGYSRDEITAILDKLQKEME